MAEKPDSRFSRTVNLAPLRHEGDAAPGPLKGRHLGDVIAIPLDAAARDGLLAANASGAVLWVTPRGVERLGGGDDWRAAIAPTLAQIVAGKLDDVQLPGASSLFASFIGEAQPGEYLLRLKDAGAPSESAVLKEVFALTDREAEVLVWIAKGKSNRDTAAILDCSPRTINKHLEQIYQKLDVENRTAAAMKVIQALSEH